MARKVSTNRPRRVREQAQTHPTSRGRLGAVIVLGALIGLVPLVHLLVDRNLRHAYETQETETAAAFWRSHRPTSEPDELHQYTPNELMPQRSGRPDPSRRPLPTHPENPVLQWLSVHSLPAFVGALLAMGGIIGVMSPLCDWQLAAEGVVAYSAAALGLGLLAPALLGPGPAWGAVAATGVLMIAPLLPWSTWVRRKALQDLEEEDIRQYRQMADGRQRGLYAYQKLSEIYYQREEYGLAAHFCRRYLALSPSPEIEHRLRRSLAKAGLKSGEGLTAPAAGDDVRESQASLDRLKADIAEADALVAALLTARGRTEHRALVLQLQCSKTAIARINRPEVPGALRLRVNRTLQAIYRLADHRTCQGLVQVPQVEDSIRAVLRRRPELAADDIRISSHSVTGNAPDRVGRDRDVCFRFVTRDGQPLSDVHHQLSGPVYGRQVRDITGLDLAVLDHVVTSCWHPDAYYTARLPVEELLAGRMAGKLPSPEDVRDTIIDKTCYWFDMGNALRRQGRLSEADQAFTEGMRQTIKEYRRHLLPFLAEHGLTADTALPREVALGLALFQRVCDGLARGDFTVDRAEYALRRLEQVTSRGKAIRVTFSSVARDLAYLTEAINRTGLRRLSRDADTTDTEPPDLPSPH